MVVPEVRSPRDDEEQRRIWEMLCRAFGWDVATYDRFAHGAPLDRVLAVFVDDEPVATARIRAFGQFFGGRRVPMGGYSPVGVAAEHRGRGYGSLITAAHYPLLRELGEVLAGLYPATTALYRKVGFELGGVWGVRKVRTRELQRVPPARGIAARRATDDDRGAIEACYARAARTQAGFLDRSARWWDRLFATEYQQIHVVDGDRPGEVAGYVRYRLQMQHPMSESTVDVSECMADSTEVMHALWQLVGTSSSIAPYTTIVSPPEHPLFFSLSEQEYLETQDEWRWMTRVVDAPGAIAARGYPPGVRGCVDFRVVDPQCDWNDGRWRFEVDDGNASLTRGGGGEVELGIGAFSALYTGYAPARTLALAGLLRGGDDRAFGALEAAFAGPAPWMPDFF
jgi:predicted acetyltransferase